MALDPEHSSPSVNNDRTLVLRGLQRHYPGTKALDWASEDELTIAPGSIHGLLGENGAGKSSLLGVISGTSPLTAGSMELLGQPYAPVSVADARSRSVEIVLQEPGLVPSLTVAENFLLGRGTVDSRWGMLIPRRTVKAVGSALQRIAPHISPQELAGRLSLEDSKLVELARAIHFRPSVLLVDEMSACLGRTRLKVLFEALKAQRDAGVAVVYISHHLDEVAHLCDTVSVLKDGKLVRTLPARTDEETLTRLMVGRDISTLYHNDRRTPESHTEVLKVTKLSLRATFDDLNFSVRAGEILGIGGLVGCGSEQLGRTLFGQIRPDSGHMTVHGERFAPKNQRQAIRDGVAYVPPDRDREGVILRASINQNVVLPTLGRRARAGIYTGRQDRRISQELIRSLGIRCQGGADLPFHLSGGNRQKVVIAKWLVNPPRILILHNPTRGIDIRAKTEIYALIQRLARAGSAVLLLSDELPELLGLSDRILVLRQGRISYETLRGEKPTEEQLVSHMI